VDSGCEHQLAAVEVLLLGGLSVLWVVVV